MAESLFPLPQWTEGDLVLLKKGRLVVESSLLIDGSEAFVVNDIVPEKAKLADEVLSMLPTKYLSDYFGKKNEAHLIDPQRLLTNPETLDRQGYLRHIANESEIDIRLFLFDGYQKIPSEYSLTRLAENYYADEPLTVLVFYFFGNPRRNEMLLVGQGSETISYRRIDKIMESASIKALEKSDYSSQIEDYIEQLSISLFWVEKDLLEEKKMLQNSKVIIENADGEKAAGRTHGEKLERIARLSLLGGGIFFVLLILFLLFLGWRRRIRYLLPVLKVPKRLGSQYGAGIGAVISFSDKTQSPENQREKRPDYFTGL